MILCPCPNVATQNDLPQTRQPEGTCEKALASPVLLYCSNDVHYVGIRPAHRGLCHQPCLLQLQLWRGPLRWSWLLGLQGTNTYKYTIIQTVNATHSGAKPFNAESLIYTGIKCRHQTGSSLSLSSALSAAASALAWAFALVLAFGASWYKYIQIHNYTDCQCNTFRCKTIQCRVTHIHRHQM